MSDTFPRITVVLPHYNQHATLAQSLESVCSQDPPPYEVVVLDDCSTDGSMEIIERFAAKYPFLRYLRYAEKSVQWTKAFCDHRHLFTGDYLVLFSGDDIIYPGCFRAITDAVRRFPQAGVVFSGYHHATYAMQIIGARMLGYSEPTFLHGEMLQRHLCRPWLVEGGVASALKMEVFVWLVENKFYELGPWLDSMGYAAAALKYDAVFLPGINGCVRVHNEAYSTRMGRDDEKSTELFQRVSRFLRAPDFASFMPPVVAAMLERKCLANLPPAVIQRYSQAPSFAQGCQLLEAQRFAEACRTLEEASTACPALPEVYGKLGLAYFGAGRFAEAEQAFRQALLFQPNDAALHTNFGACLQNQGKPGEAMWSYWQALHLNPNFADALANLGAAYASFGRVQEAIGSYRQALRIAPQHPQAQARLQQLLSAVGQTR